MKICTITCNNAVNYGARLQAYALYRYLADRGHDVRVIDYAPDYLAFKTRQWYWPGLDIKGWGRLLLQWSMRRRMIRKHAALESFSRSRTVLTRRYTSIEDLRIDPPRADIYIAGSDQIWNTEFPNGTDPAFYLGFGSDSAVRSSYAASFATQDIRDSLKNKVKRLMSGLDHISVREASGVDIAASLGHDAMQVCDPVWLIDAESWANDIADHTGEGEKYILVYDFMHSDDIRRVAQRTARLRGAKIFSVSPVPVDYAQRNFCDCSAESFVALVKNADCVVSNSLHGSLFAMLFHRDFLVVNRSDGLNVRMADLLGRYDLSHRIVAPDCPDSLLTSTIDYKPVSQRMERDIQASSAWLDNITGN